MAVNPELHTAELKRAVEQFSKNIGIARHAMNSLVISPPRGIPITLKPLSM